MLFLRSHCFFQQDSKIRSSGIISGASILFLAFTSSIMGRRISSRIPGMSSMSAGGVAYSTASIRNPAAISGFRIWVRV